jgi:Protein of unknown function (DUF2844)
MGTGIIRFGHSRFVAVGQHQSLEQRGLANRLISSLRTMTHTPAALLAWGVLLLLVTLPSTAFAALGGNVASVDTDRVHVEGALMRIVQSDAYAFHEIRSASGTMIREYINSSGIVFAVAWRGCLKIRPEQ